MFLTYLVCVHLTAATSGIFLTFSLVLIYVTFLYAATQDPFNIFHGE